MWKAVVGHDISVKVEAPGDDWDTDPDFVNDISEKEQRWGSKTIEGSGHTAHINIHQLRSKVSEEHEVIKKKELETGPKASYGYGGKFGTERDRMDECAVGHEYVADIGKHSSQTDAAQGFGGKYGIQRDRADKSALGFEYKGEVEKHSSQKDYSKGFGGRYGVERDKVDKAAVGFTYKNQTEKHDSQKDYAKGFGGQYGVQKGRVDKSDAGFHEMATPTFSNAKTRPLEAGASSGASRLRSQFENMVKSAEEESRRQAEEEQARWQAREHPAARQKGAKREDEETPPTLPPRPADLGEELYKIPSQDQPIYSESLDVGGDYEELPEPSDYCDSANGGADYEELPAPLGEQDAIYDNGGDGGEDYEDVLPVDPSQTQTHLRNMDNVYQVKCHGTCAVALYDYQGDGDDEISFDPDETITHIEMVNEGWWQGQCRGKVGFFPANYVRLLQ
ncbi:hematopoietic lineage cell-specific protein isoform X2 [Heliangelus exortis]